MIELLKNKYMILLMTVAVIVTLVSSLNEKNAQKNESQPESKMTQNVNINK